MTVPSNCEPYHWPSEGVSQVALGDHAHNRVGGVDDRHPRDVTIGKHLGYFFEKASSRQATAGAVIMSPATVSSPGVNTKSRIDTIR